MELRLLFDCSKGRKVLAVEAQGALIVPGSVIDHFHPAVVSAPLSLPEK